MFKKISLFCLLLCALPMPVIAKQEVAFNCIFPKSAPGEKPAVFDLLAIFVPNYGQESTGKAFELIDPANLAKGATFESLVNGENGGDFAFISSRSSNPRMILIANPSDKPAIFNSTIGNFDQGGEPRLGQCAALGEGARESFDFWKRHPNKIGDAPE